jgi:hypothetical protein
MRKELILAALLTVVLSSMGFSMTNGKGRFGASVDAAFSETAWKPDGNGTLDEASRSFYDGVLSSSSSYSGAYVGTHGSELYGSTGTATISLTDILTRTREVGVDVSYGLLSRLDVIAHFGLYGQALTYDEHLVVSGGLEDDEFTNQKHPCGEAPRPVMGVGLRGDLVRTKRFSLSAGAGYKRYAKATYKVNSSGFYVGSLGSSGQEKRSTEVSVKRDVYQASLEATFNGVLGMEPYVRTAVEGGRVEYEKSYSYDDHYQPPPAWGFGYSDNQTIRTQKIALKLKRKNIVTGMVGVRLPIGGTEGRDGGLDLSASAFGDTAYHASGYIRFGEAASLDDAGLLSFLKDRKFRLFTAMEYWMIGNAYQDIRDAWDKDVQDFDESTLSRKLSVGTGVRVGAFVPSRLKGVDFGGSVAYITGPKAEFKVSETLLAPPAAVYDQTDNYKTHFVRILAEGRKSFTVSKKVDVRLGAGIGVASGKFENDYTCDATGGGSCYGESVTKSFSGLTYEAGPSVVLKGESVNVEFGVVYAVFPKMKSFETSMNSTIMEFKWNPIGLRMGMEF